MVVEAYFIRFYPLFRQIHIFFAENVVFLIGYSRLLFVIMQNSELKRNIN